MKKVLILLIVAFVIACDDGSSGSNNFPIILPNPEGDLANKTEFNNPLFDEVDAIGFFDYDRYDSVRRVRNDLFGKLSGQVQFVQTHSVNPNGNAENNLPLLITEREALLLFTPTNPYIRSVSVEIYVDGEFKGKKTLKHPNLMPKSDNVDSRGRKDLIYSRKSWSCVLDWQYIKSGLSLKFIDSDDKDGTLLADNIEFGAAAEGIFTFLRLGMLTEYPKDGNGSMMSEPARAMTEYFQTAPFAKLVSVTYENVSLPKVIVASGVIYDSNSSDPKLRYSKDEGDVYSGDMRENVGKSQISIGINLANYGIPSATMSQGNPELFFSMVAHLAQGVYSNGVKRHGLSGGGGIITLIDTVGNEFSHEVGHGYGLGHFPGEVDKDYFWSAHHSDSGWGYDAFNKMMRANIHWGWDGEGAYVNDIKSPETFKRMYSYNRDSMAGGEAVSGISRYTHYTGYSALRIQNRLASLAVPSATSSTGYMKWDKEESRMKEFSFQSADKRLKPKKIGVPVFTVIGGYNPDNYTQSLLYKPLRGNYGNIFTFPKPNKSDNKSCWLKVSYVDNTFEEVDVFATKKAGQYGNAFQLAINVEEARKPQTAELFCSKNQVVTKLYSVDFPQNLPPMPKPVIIGKENGFKDAIDYEASKLNDGFKKYIGEPFPTLTNKEIQYVKAIGDDLSKYNSDIKSVVQAFLNWEDRKRLVSRFIKKYKNELVYNNAQRVEEFNELLFDNGLIQSSQSLDVVAMPLIVGNNNYLSLAIDKVVVKAVDKVTDNERWVMDLNGRIHSGADFGKCLTAVGYDSCATINTCSDTNTNQFWKYDNGAIRSKNNPNSVLDFATHKSCALSYSYHGGGNQIWKTMRQSNEPFLALLSSENIRLVISALKNR